MSAISVCILSHNRPHDLYWVIESVFTQDCSPLEVLVVDNGSRPELLEGLHQLYPTVKVIALHENIGVAARAVGIEQAKGDLVITLDDDVGFADPTALRTLINEFDRNPSATCLTFSILKPDCFVQSKSDWGHPKPFSSATSDEFVTPWFSEGACAFRRNIFSKVESYWSALHFGMEGPELALRLLEIEAEIRYIPTVRVIHRRSEIGRSPERAYFHHTRSLILMSYRNLPAHAIPSFLGPRLFILSVLALRAGSLSKWTKGVRAGILDSYRLRNHRNPVSSQTWMRYQFLRRDMPSIRKRIGRYLANYSDRIEVTQPQTDDQNAYS